MAAEANTGSRYAAIDEVLTSWRQGDYVLGEHWFVHRFDPAFPATAEARTAAASPAPEPGIAETQVAGLIIVSQTCDVVRSCAERPYIEVCPLVEVDAAALRQIERGRRPRYGFVPLLADRKLVADLDRTMTVEKPVVATWERFAGWTTDTQARAFAASLARKRVRFAFPDDFTVLVRALESRLTEKHDKESDEGRSLRVLREIRVHAAPSWDDLAVTLTFWFVRPDEAVDFHGESWSTFLEKWLRLVPEGGRFVSVQGQVTVLEDMTAADYVGSDPFDLDHLSARSV